MTRCNISEMCNEHGEIDDCDFAEWLDETQPDSYEKSLCRCEGCVGELEGVTNEPPAHDIPAACR